MYSAGESMAVPFAGRGRRCASATVAAMAPVRASMPTNDDFNSWIQAVGQAADRNAFACLFRHFAPRVKGFLMRSGSSAELAEELCQETMVIVWRRAVSFDPARAALSTWIFTIARNLRTDYHRRADGTVNVADTDDWSPEQEPADTQPSPDDRVLAAQQEQGVHFALAALPPDQALVLRLSFFEEHAHARIAEQLGIPLGTVKSRIRLAVAQLRRTLERFGP